MSKAARRFMRTLSSGEKENIYDDVEIERTTDSGGSSNDQLQQGLQSLLESLPFQVMDAEAAKQEPAHARCAAELRPDELMRTAAGLPVPGLDTLASLRFPEPNAR